MRVYEANRGSEVVLGRCTGGLYCFRELIGVEALTVQEGKECLFAQGAYTGNLQTHNLAVVKFVADTGSRPRHCQTNWTGLVEPTIKRPQAAN